MALSWECGTASCIEAVQLPPQIDSPAPKATHGLKLMENAVKLGKGAALGTSGRLYAYSTRSLSAGGATPAFATNRDYNGGMGHHNRNRRAGVVARTDGRRNRRVRRQVRERLWRHLNKIDTISVQNGELHFTILAPKPDPARSKGEPARSAIRSSSRASPANRELELEGSDRPPTKWTGVRAPATEPGKRAAVALFNGQNLTGESASNPQCP